MGIGQHARHAPAMCARVVLSAPLLVASLCAGCSDGVAVPIRLSATGAGQDGAQDGAQDAAQDGAQDGAHDGGWDGGQSSGHGHDRESRIDEAHCAPALDWPEDLASSEQELVDRINQLRGRYIACGSREYDDLPPLHVVPALQCSARLHSMDMKLRHFEDYTNPDGEDPGDRMRAAGFPVGEASESIAFDTTDASRVLGQLLDEWHDCRNLATDQFDSIGIGRYEDAWTLDFARH